MVNEILTIGIPALAVLTGILINNSRLSDLRAYIDSRFKAERRANDAHFQPLLSKVDDIDNRLTRLEDRCAASIGCRGAGDGGGPVRLASCSGFSERNSFVTTS